MKSDNGEDTTVVTPSKKLKQSRLPFKLITEVSSLPKSPVSRKRKLSTENHDIASKIGRLSKENNTVTEVLTVSDDENCSDSTKKEDEPALSDTLNKDVSPPRSEKKALSTSFVQENSSPIDNANLTPKQLQRKLEALKKREEKELERLEREKKRQQEKEERAKVRQEKEDLKKKEREEKEEQKRKEKEEKEEQKRKEKEEKDKQREAEKKLREEKEELKRKEKEEKEEQRRKEKEEQRRKEKEAKEEEKRKKQEALELEKQEQEMKKKKAAEAFVNFFVPKQKVGNNVSVPISQNSALSSFTIKADMRLAPIVRCELTAEGKEKMDELIKKQNEKKLYLKCLQKGLIKPGGYGKTWPTEEKDDDVMIIEDELPPLEGGDEDITCEASTREKLRAKMFKFHENRRPPYWGTWRKRSDFIKPRRPFGRDQKQLDYTIDSDEEWEEEEGESIDGSRAGSDDEAADGDEYEVDNEFFVPHGYLSDEEATMDEDDVLSLSPETQKARLKHLEDEFESELKKPTGKLKPRLFGPLFVTDGQKPDSCGDALWNYFHTLAMIMDDPTPLLQPTQEPQETEKKKVRRKKQTEGDEKSPKEDKKKKQKSENKDKKSKTEPKKTDPKKNQPVINSFLKKLKSP